MKPILITLLALPVVAFIHHTPPKKITVVTSATVQKQTHSDRQIPPASTATAANLAQVASTLPPAATAAPAASTQPVAATPMTHEDIMAAAGIAASDYDAVDYIVSHESGWCATKWEGEYGACPAFHGVSDYDGYGLCQSTPPQKMAAAGADWETNPVTQLKWCTSHAIADYGGWWPAYYHWLSHHNW